jgi:hypothetical protein
MTSILIIIFIIGYLAIALEHPIRVNKAASALDLSTFPASKMAPCHALDLRAKVNRCQ